MTVSSSKSQLYRADCRGGTASELFRRLSTFNFDGYHDESREPFGALEAWNDETLAPGRNLFRKLNQPSLLLIIPLVGTVTYQDSLGNVAEIHTEEIGVLTGQSGHAYQLENAYEKDLINFLQIWLAPGSFMMPGFKKSAFSLENRNTMSRFYNPAAAPVVGLMGLFDGRQSGSYILKNTENGLFAFVLSGAFEFDEKLLEWRDGVAISGVAQVAFEALSENALLILMEIPQKRRINEIAT